MRGTREVLALRRTEAAEALAQLAVKFLPAGPGESGAAGFPKTQQDADGFQVVKVVSRASLQLATVRQRLSC